MEKFEVKQGTHIVLKVADVEKYLTDNQKYQLKRIQTVIEYGRIESKKKLNDYYVVNLDEPYADKIYEVIKNGEIKKEN